MYEQFIDDRLFVLILTPTLRPSVPSFSLPISLPFFILPLLDIHLEETSY